MSASNYLENILLNLTLKATAFTPPSSVYIGLFKNNANVMTNLEAGTLTDEVSGNGYARRVITFNTATGTTGSTSNSQIITFPTATASWGTISHVAILNAATGGNVLFYGPLTSSRIVNSGGVFRISVNAINVSID